MRTKARDVPPKSFCPILYKKDVSGVRRRTHKTCQNARPVRELCQNDQPVRAALTRTDETCGESVPFTCSKRSGSPACRTHRAFWPDCLPDAPRVLARLPAALTVRPTLPDLSFCYRCLLQRPSEKQQTQPTKISSLRYNSTFMPSYSLFEARCLSPSC